METKQLNGFEYFKLAFKKYAQFSGRSRRREYWYFVLFSAVISFIISAIFEPLGILFSLVIFIPSLAVQVRRLHDIGRSGWLLLAYIIVLGAVGIILSMQIALLVVSSTTPSVLFFVSILIAFVCAVYMLALMVRDSQPGENKYGPNPKEISPATPVQPAVTPSETPATPVQ